MIFLLFLPLFLQVSAFNVLVLSPAFAGSHMNFMAHLADILTDAGHKVTFLVPIVDELTRHRLGVKTTEDVVVVERDEIMRNEKNFFGDLVDQIWTLDTHRPTWSETFTFWNNLMTASCANLMRNKEVFDQMKEKNFDVAILEPLSVCGLGYFKQLGIEKTILASSCVFYDVVLTNTGEPEELSYVPGWNSATSDKMSISERFLNWQFSKDFHMNMEKTFDLETKIYREHLGADIPDWRELLPAASFFFTNSIPYLDFPRPVLQKTVAIGGITVDLEKIKSTKLDERWNEILSRRPYAMLISFGSMMKSSEMPIQWKENLLNVIRSEPNVTFIWKYESNDVSFADDVGNIHFSKWVPQSALLADSRLSAFLTHGGLGSTHELAICGKPAIMVPVFCDQVRNARMLERHESSILVWKTDLGDFDIVKRAVESILYDKKYTENANRLAEIINNQPNQPKDVVVKNVEFLAKFGPFSKMDPHGRKLNFLQKTFLDIYLIFGLVFIVLVAIVLFFLRLMVRKLKISNNCSWRTGLDKKKL